MASNEMVVDLKIKTKIYRSFTNSGKLIDEDDKKDEIDLSLLPDQVPTATVSFDTSLTKNLGNYNSAKVGVFCSVPCVLNEDEMQGALSFAKKFCEDALVPSLNEFVSYVKEKYPEAVARIS
jgi:hypothetical protein